jgi:hypothetical protein
MPRSNGLRNATSRGVDWERSQPVEFPEWQLEFEAAIFEEDPALMSGRFERAEGAILSRLQATTVLPNAGRERVALAASFAALVGVRKGQRNLSSEEAAMRRYKYKIP